MRIITDEQLAEWCKHCDRALAVGALLMPAAQLAVALAELAEWRAGTASLAQALELTPPWDDYTAGRILLRAQVWVQAAKEHQATAAREKARADSLEARLRSYVGCMACHPDCDTGSHAGDDSDGHHHSGRCFTEKGGFVAGTEHESTVPFVHASHVKWADGTIKKWGTDFGKIRAALGLERFTGIDKIVETASSLTADLAAARAEVAKLQAELREVRSRAARLERTNRECGLDDIEKATAEVAGLRAEMADYPSWEQLVALRRVREAAACAIDAWRRMSRTQGLTRNEIWALESATNHAMDTLDTALAAASPPTQHNRERT